MRRMTRTAHFMPLWALLLAGAALFAPLALVSCATSRTSQEVLDAYGDTGSYEVTALSTTPLAAPQATQYKSSLGDFDPISLDETFAMTLSFGKLKVRQLNKTYLVPRNNTVEVYFRDGANSLCLILGQQSREGLVSAAAAFIDGQESGTLVNAKPTAANALWSGTCDLWWGIATPANGATGIVMHANTKFVDGLPYLVLRVPSAPSDDRTAYSPYTELYFSPTQLKTFCSQIEQDYLESLVDEISVRAYTY